MLDPLTYLLHKHITTSQRLIEGHVKSQYPIKFPIFIDWHTGIIPILTSLICYNIQIKENFDWMFMTLPNVSIYEYF